MKPVCRGGSLLQEINNSDKPSNTCKGCSDGNVSNISNGAVSRDGGSCCFEGNAQTNNPISDLDKCPNRVLNTSWVHEYDGCSLSSILTVGSDVNNPAEGYDTQFSSSKCRDTKSEADCSILPCDKHDKCYQTCAQDIDAGRLACDDAMRSDMLDVCNKSIEDDYIKLQCSYWADEYYWGLRRLGGIFYKGRQKQVCNCCI